MAIVPFPDTSAHPRTMMIHSLNTNSTLTAVAGPTGSIDVAGGTQLDSLGLLASYSYIRNYNVIIDMLIFGYFNEILIDFIAIFLSKTYCTIFWMNPGSVMQRLMNAQKFKN